MGEGGKEGKCYQQSYWREGGREGEREEGGGGREGGREAKCYQQSCCKHSIPTKMMKVRASSTACLL